MRIVSTSLLPAVQPRWAAFLIISLLGMGGRRLAAQNILTSPFALPSQDTTTQQNSQLPQITVPQATPANRDQPGEQEMDQDGNPINASATQPNATTASRNQNQNQSQGQNRNQATEQYRNQQLANLRQRQPLPPSEFQKVVYASVGRILPIFGANLFTDSPSTFAPVDNIPVTPDYVIGPGDELQLQVWGQINQHGNYIVDRTGSIQLPEVGTVHVAGIQFSQVTAFLKSQLGRVYRNFDLNVNLGQLRSIQVFVVGQARQPGSYTIGSLSTLLNALFASGGPLPTGSLRDIQVKRGSDTITHFDLYDLLLRGDKSKDIRLAPGDVIFIPPVGQQIAVAGSVISQGIYELRDEKSFAQILELAGGLTNAASASRVRIERIYQHRERSFLEFDLAAADIPPVQNGDIVMINAVVPRFKDSVTLRGNVANPGRYVWHPGLRISDIIPNRDALITRNYYERRNALAQNNTDYAGPMQEGTIGIQSGQRNTTTTQTTRQTAGQTSGQMMQQNTVSGTGGSSAASALNSGDEKFSARTDVILTAPDIDWDYAVIERQNATTLTTLLLPFNLGKVVLENDPSQNLPLLAGDVVTIFSKADIRVPNAQQTKFVKLEGEFAQAGVYSLLPGETLGQLVQRAGGLTSDADLFASEFTRDSVRRLQRQRLDEYANSLEAEMVANTSATLSTALTDRDAAAAQSADQQNRIALDRLRQAQPTGRIVLQFKPDSKTVGAIADLALEDGDRFVVPKTPSSVTVQGQVYNSNAFLYEDGKRVQDYMHLAGGPNRTADKHREYLLRADGSVISYQYASSRQHGNFNGIRVLPGDTIVVPPELEKNATLRNLLNISTILQGFGIGAAAIEVLK